MKLLTVAVPAYNSEKYLRKCLDSFVDERILPQLEVIVVNDGSKDRTLEIAQEYAKGYPAAFRVIDKENGGHGSGINAAAQCASGKYFQVVDSDDWVVTENMPALLERLGRAEADIVLCQYHMVDMTTGKRQPFVMREIPLGRQYTIAEFMEYPRNARNCCFFHGVIYRTDFYRGTSIRLSEKIFYEDQEYATLPFYYAETVLPLELFIYQYMVGNASQSISNANQVKNKWQIEKVFWNICDFYCLHGEMEQAKKEYFLFKLSSLVLSYYVAGLLKDPNRREGRVSAQKMHDAVRERCPDLYGYAEKKYRVAVLLHRLHISAEMLEKAKKSRLYYAIRRFL